MLDNAKQATNVRVVARIRPLSEIESAKGAEETLRSFNDLERDFLNPEEELEYKYTYNPKAEPELVQCQEQHAQHPGAGKTRWFELDAVFDQDSTQEEIYIRSGAKHSICEDIFKGFNCTILAYGQTGAGKTYSMGTASRAAVHDYDANNNHSGSFHQPIGDELKRIANTDGMIPRACNDLFAMIDEKCDGNAKVELSYLEIYNEELRDLLVEDSEHNQHHLKIRETLDGEVYVSGLKSRVVTSPYDIGLLMEEASKRRVVKATSWNAYSSRSHAMCVLRIQGVIDNNDSSNGKMVNCEGPDKFESKLTLVDLAGSERMKKTGAHGSRAKEGININKSLLALGQVVAALAEKDKRKKRIPPYRDSKLTRLLQDSLGGNSQTIMVACVSPADICTDESINTLRYATSARNIKNTATRNLVQNISPEEAHKLQRENQLLKQQVTELRESLKMMMISNHNDNISISGNFSITSDGSTIIGGSSATTGSGNLDEEDNISIESLTINVDTINTNNSNPNFMNSNTHIDSNSNSHVKVNDNELLQLLAQQEKIAQNQSRRIVELEENVEKLKRKVKKAKLNLRRSSVATAIELPALRMQYQELELELEKKTQVEEENIRLREELQDLKNEAESAQYAATKLTDIMDQVHNLSTTRKQSMDQMKQYISKGNSTTSTQMQASTNTNVNGASTSAKNNSGTPTDFGLVGTIICGFVIAFISYLVPSSA